MHAHRPSKLDLVRSVCAAWEEGDFTDAEWADPEIEFAFADGPAPAQWSGVAAMRAAWLDYLSNWQDVRVAVDEYRELDDERVLVLIREHGRGRTSGLEVSQLQARGANLFHVRKGKVIRLVLFLDRDRALAELDLKD